MIYVFIALTIAYIAVALVLISREDWL